MDNQNVTHVLEHMIEQQIGSPVRYNPETGEFEVVNESPQAGEGAQ